MNYQDHFRLADDIISHVDTVIHEFSDPFISSRYIGFISVSAVTVYELAVKKIFCDFASREHEVLGSFVFSYFDRINGQIKLQKIKNDYIPRFGKKYVDIFNEKIEESELTTLKKSGRSIKNSYNNIIVWRNEFAHKGDVPPTATYQEAIDSYFTGKEVIHCLSAAMNQ